MKELLNVSPSFAHMLLEPTIQDTEKRKVHVGLGAKLQAILTSSFSSLAVCKNGEGRTGRSCHVSDVNVYPGRQRGEWVRLILRLFLYSLSKHCSNECL